MEAVLLKVIADLIAAGGIYAIFALWLIVTIAPVLAVWRAWATDRKSFETERTNLNKEIGTCRDVRSDELKTTIQETIKCMQAVSTTMTTLMVAVERGTMSNDARLKSLETLNTTLEGYGRVLDNLAEEMRDIRRGVTR
jgi:hypothetical protein